MKINDFSAYRYSITSLPNDSQKHFAVPGFFNLTMATTYATLIKRHLEVLRATTSSLSPEQVERNHLTALRSFLKSVQKFETSPVGPELGEDYQSALKRHVQDAGLGARSQRDRKSLLGAWRRTFISLGELPEKRVGRERRMAKARPEEQNPFERALWDGLRAAKLAPKAAALRSGTSTSAIGRWTRGALPNVRTKTTFARLEDTLGMTRGTLLDAFNLATAKGQAGPNNAYRQRLKVNKRLIYRLVEGEVGTRLQNEWTKFLEFKTSKIDGALVRPTNSRWALTETRNATIPSHPLWARGNRVCPTANLTWQLLSAFFGFLRLQRESGGYGLTNLEAQTLAWLAVPEAIEAFIDFQTERSDGLIHGGQRGFAAVVKALNHPLHGYLTQSPSFQDCLPTNVSAGRNWSRMCKEAMQVASSCMSEAHGKSRDPSEPIRYLLNLEEPLAPVFSAMQKLRRIGDGASRNSIQEALARRDELLLGLLVSNPLRRKNLITLTYKADNTGNVYKSTNGQWRIRISGGMFKNRTRVGSSVYDVPVASWLAPLLSDYVQNSRPVLCKGNEPAHLLLNKKGGRLQTLGRQVFRLTQLYIPGSGGFGPHAFRHLVATDWLTKNHNDFLTVAELLNDTIEVVMKNYSHLKKDVAFNRFESYVQRLLPSGMAS